MRPPGQFLWFLVDAEVPRNFLEVGGMRGIGEAQLVSSPSMTWRFRSDYFFRTFGQLASALAMFPGMSRCQVF